jgi:hypothetical protein
MSSTSVIELLFDCNTEREELRHECAVKATRSAAYLLIYAAERAGWRDVCDLAMKALNIAIKRGDSKGGRV